LSKSTQIAFQNRHAFDVSKGHNVGWKTVKAFLNGDWKEWNSVAKYVHAIFKTVLKSKF